MSSLFFDNQINDASQDFDLLFSQIDAFDSTMANIFDLNQLETSPSSSSQSSSPEQVYQEKIFKFNSNIAQAEVDTFQFIPSFSIDADVTTIVKSPQIIKDNLNFTNALVSSSKKIVEPISINLPKKDENGKMVEIVLNFEPMNEENQIDTDLLLFEMINKTNCNDFDENLNVLSQSSNETCVDLRDEGDSDGDDSAEDSHGVSIDDWLHLII